MDNRIAMVSIIVENGDSVVRLNEVLHEYAPVDRINALTGNLGRLPGVSAKAVYAPAKRRS